MKLNSVLLLNILILVISCNGQGTSQAMNSTLAQGDTVKELGKNIMVVYQDKKNIYWFGSWENGVYRYDGTTILHYTTKRGLPYNRIDEIKEDRSGNIYFNSCSPGSAISVFNGQTFTTLPVSANKEWKLLPDDLWFKYSYDSAFVYRFDGNTLYKLQFPKHPSYSDPYAVYSIYRDSKGNVWFGTNPLGVCRYNGKSCDWISEEDVTELHNGPANGVRSIIEDKDGYFWFNSMYRYNVYGNHSAKDNLQNFYTREKSIGNLDGSPDSDFWEYMSVVKDNNGDLWIATYGNGVWRYDGKETTYYPVRKGSEAEDITLFSIYKDNKGALWLGTHENGAYKFNGQTFERFNP